jgi:hypothetical protein
MSRPDKKQRHKAKRQAKREAARRRESISPVKRLASCSGELECWMSDGFEEVGQIQIFAYKCGAGMTGIACFLVDRGVVGLKDAWTRMRIDRVELDEMLQASRDRGIPMKRCTPDDVRRWVAGGIRWAHDNGMRLPKDWVRAAAFFGGVGDWASADVSQFEKEFAGHPEDLRRRLIASPFDEFVQRSDINFIFSHDAPVLDDRAGDDLDPDVDEDFIDLPIEELNALAQELTESAAELARLTERWLTEKNEAPSKELVQAWISTMVASMLSNAALPDAPREDRSKFGVAILMKMASKIEDSRFVEYSLGMKQVVRHLGANPAILRNAVLKDRSAGDLVHQPAQE